jgi:hypothetical protein
MKVFTVALFGLLLSCSDTDIHFGDRVKVSGGIYHLSEGNVVSGSRNPLCLFSMRYLVRLDVRKDLLFDTEAFCSGEIEPVK